MPGGHRKHVKVPVMRIGWLALQRVTVTAVTAAAAATAGVVRGCDGVVGRVGLLLW